MSILSNLFNPVMLLFLGISMLVTALLVIYFEGKMREQNHKISSMLSLVTSLAEEVNLIKIHFNHISAVNNNNYQSNAAINKIPLPNKPENLGERLISVSDNEENSYANWSNDEVDEDDDDSDDDDDDEVEEEDDGEEEDDNDDNDEELDEIMDLKEEDIKVLNVDMNKSFYLSNKDEIDDSDEEEEDLEELDIANLSEIEEENSIQELNNEILIASDL